MAKSYLEANEVESLERAATNLRDRLLIRLLSHLGCRISEALGIAVGDIDLDNHTVTIQHLKARCNPEKEDAELIAKANEPLDLDAFVEFERQEKEIAERYKKRQYV